MYMENKSSLRAEVDPEVKIEKKIEREQREPSPQLTVYYLRHGESSEDKTDPLRELTEKGKRQVLEAVDGISDTIDLSTPVRLYSSGSERTRQQVLVAAWLLHSKGFENITIESGAVPKKEILISGSDISFGAKREREEMTDEEKKQLSRQLGIQITGPGIQKRIGELKAPKEYMKSLRDREAETGIGAVVHWLTDEQYPQGTESPADKVAVLEEAVESTQKLAERMKRLEREPVVAFVFGHSSALTAYAQDKLGFDPARFGEVENVEGLKMEFTGSGKPTIEPSGRHIEKGFSK